MTVELLPVDSCSAARRTVADVLTDLGRDDLVDDAATIVSELVTNAVLHTGTDVLLSVRPHQGGVRIEVTDGSPVLPRWTPVGDTATSGRGLILVELLSARWGAERTDGGGKIVWAELSETAEQGDDVTMDDLLAAWSDEDFTPAPETVAVRLADIDVSRMLESRSHTHDLLRELTLARLVADSNPSEHQRTVLELAAHLTTANQEFHEARQQMWNRTLAAAQRGEQVTTLELSLPPGDAGPAAAWLEAMDEADALAAAGELLLPKFPDELVQFRRDYIADIITQLTAAAPAS